MKRRTKDPGPESDIMTLHEVADYLHCHYTTIFRLVHAGELPGFRLGGSWRFRRAQIDEWMVGQHGSGAGSGIKGLKPRATKPTEPTGGVHGRFERNS